MSEAGNLSPREYLQKLCDEYDATLDDVTLLDPKNDPMSYGTDADHKKAEWFRNLFEYAVRDRDGGRVHVRGVHYATVSRDEEIAPPTACSWDVYQNTQTCFDYLTAASVAARVLGYVDFDHILDEKNQQLVVTEYRGHELSPEPEASMARASISTPDLPSVEEAAEMWATGADDYISSVSKTVASKLSGEVTVDLETAQPYHVELWSEKSLPDEVKDEARRHGVDVIVEGEGHLSYTVAADFARRVNDAGKPAVVLYLTDYDPAGDTMAEAMAGKLVHLDHTGRLEQRVVLERVAITSEQVEKHDLPRKPINVSSSSAAYETRAEAFEAEEGSGAVELNALESDIDLYRRLVREAVAPLNDDDLRGRVRKAKRKWADDVRDLVEDDLDDHRAEFEEAIEQEHDECAEFNDLLDDLTEQLEELRVARPSDRAKALAESVVETFDPPTFEPPEGDGTLSERPLYDSDRDYVANLERASGTRLRPHGGGEADE